MNLQILHPLAIIDLETTGVDLATDKIVEIAIVKLMPDGTTQKKRKLVNPQKPIPPASSSVHGITDEMVKNAPDLQTDCQRNKTVFE
jgi:DNA polymerase-3 subunit epsilon